MQRGLAIYEDPSSDNESKSSTTAMARHARRQRRRDLATGRLTPSKFDDAAHEDITSSTTAARDARRNRYGSGLNDISNTAVKKRDEGYRLETKSSRQSRTLILPDMNANVPRDRSLSKSSEYRGQNGRRARGRSLRRGYNDDEDEEDDRSLRSGTSHAREVRMNRTGRSTSRAPDMDDDDDSISLGSIYRNGRSRPTSTYKSKYLSEETNAPETPPVTMIKARERSSRSSTTNNNNITNGSVTMSRKSPTNSDGSTSLPRYSPPPPPPPPPPPKTTNTNPAKTSTSRRTSNNNNFADVTKSKNVRKGSSAMSIDFDKEPLPPNEKKSKQKSNPAPTAEEEKILKDLQLTEATIHKDLKKTDADAMKKEEYVNNYGHVLSGFKTEESRKKDPQTNEPTKSDTLSNPKQNNDKVSTSTVIHSQQTENGDNQALRESNTNEGRKHTASEISTSSSPYVSDNGNGNVLKPVKQTAKENSVTQAPPQVLMTGNVVETVQSFTEQSKSHEKEESPPSPIKAEKMNPTPNPEQKPKQKVEKTNVLLNPAPSVDNDSVFKKGPTPSTTGGDSKVFSTPDKEKPSSNHWDLSSPRWNQFEKDEESLQIESKEASARAIGSAMEQAAMYDILNSPDPNKTGEPVMVLPVDDAETYQNDELNQSSTSLDEEANLEKFRNTNQTDKPSSRSISSSMSSMLNKFSGGYREEEKKDYERLATDVMSLDAPPLERRVKSEKPWSKSLKKISSSIDKVKASSNERKEEVSAHDRVREEAMRMLNLADSVGTKGSSRSTTRNSRRFTSKRSAVPDMSENISDKLMDRIKLTDDDDHSAASDDTEVTNNSKRTMSIGHFSITGRDSDDENDDEFSTHRISMRQKDDDFTVLYDRDEEKQEQPAEQQESSWSSRFSGSSLRTSLYSSYLFNEKYDDAKPTSARGMMRASPENLQALKYMEDDYERPSLLSRFLSLFRRDPYRDPSGSNANLILNAIRAELSKDRTKKICSLCVFTVFFVTFVAIIGDLASSHNSGNKDKIPMILSKGGAKFGHFKPITFFAMSDIGINDKFAFTKQVKSLPDSARFAVHLGDINDASKSLCAPNVYTQAESILSLSPIPIVALPGNEDYAACPDPFESLNDWRNSFVDLEDLWIEDGSWLQRQSKRKENFAFVQNTVLFLGINIAGKFARDDEIEWQELDEDNIVWTRSRLEKYADEMQALVIFGHTRPGPRQYDYYFQHVQRYLEFSGIPVLYVHGDALLDDPHLKVYEPYTELGFEMKALEVQHSGITEPVEVVVSEDGFVIDRNSF